MPNTLSQFDMRTDKSSIYSNNVTYQIKSIPEVPTSSLYANNKYITELNQNILNHIKHNEVKYIPTVIVFYASWCYHCRNFVPIYTNIAKEFTENYVSMIQFGSIDCVLYRQLCSDYNIPGYPTIKLFNFPSGNEFSYS